MAQQAISFVLEVFFGLFIYGFLLRFLMQAMRAPFRNPAGNAVIALTDWAVAALAPDRLMARISGANVAAEKVARAVGLAPLGVPTSAPRLWAFPG